MLWAQLNLPDSMSIIMRYLNSFHDWAMLILIFVFVYVVYVLAFTSVSPLLDRQTIDSHQLELVWTLLPVLALYMLAVPSLYILYLMEDLTTPAVMVGVTGYQWYWGYEHSLGADWVDFDSYMVEGTFHNMEVDNRLSLPAGVPIVFQVTSADVIHSWTVPALGLKMDAIPGRLNFLSSTAAQTGVFYGQCSEICGSNHSFMPIVVEYLTIKGYLSMSS